MPLSNSILSRERERETEVSFKKKFFEDLTVAGIENLPLMLWAIKLLLANRSLAQKETLIQYFEPPFLGGGGENLLHPSIQSWFSDLRGRWSFRFFLRSLFCVVYFYPLSRGVLQIGGMVGGEYTHGSIIVVA